MSVLFTTSCGVITPLVLVKSTPVTAPLTLVPSGCAAWTYLPIIEPA